MTRWLAGSPWPPGFTGVVVVVMVVDDAVRDHSAGDNTPMNRPADLNTQGGREYDTNTLRYTDDTKNNHVPQPPQNWYSEGTRNRTTSARIEDTLVLRTLDSQICLAKFLQPKC